MEREKLTVIFDDGCALCQNAVHWMGKNFEEGLFDFMPCDSPETREAFPDIDEKKCKGALHLITPDGTIIKGDRAIRELFTRDRRWAFLSFLWKIPLIRSLLPGIYRWVAHNRHRISSLFFSSPKD